MSGSPHVGMETTVDFEVEGRLLTDVGGTFATEVLSTPGIVDGRKLRFAVEVTTHDGRTIRVARHERRVIATGPQAQ
jgi:predicted thioesterase